MLREAGVRPHQEAHHESDGHHAGDGRRQEDVCRVLPGFCGLGWRGRDEDLLVEHVGHQAAEWLNARWVDLQQEFDDRLGLHNSLALKHALGAMDHKFEGTQHTALADAINTSAILTLMQDDAKFKETMKPVLEILQPKDDLASSIGDLCPELAKLQKDL